VILAPFGVNPLYGHFLMRGGLDTYFLILALKYPREGIYGQLLRAILNEERMRKKVQQRDGVF
jgi:hypothetical protein